MTQILELLAPHVPDKVFILLPSEERDPFEIRNGTQRAFIKVKDSGEAEYELGTLKGPLLRGRDSNILHPVLTRIDPPDVGTLSTGADQDRLIPYQKGLF